MFPQRHLHQYPNNAQTHEQGPDFKDQAGPPPPGHSCALDVPVIRLALRNAKPMGYQQDG